MFQTGWSWLKNDKYGENQNGCDKNFVNAGSTEDVQYCKAVVKLSNIVT